MTKLKWVMACAVLGMLIASSATMHRAMLAESTKPEWAQTNHGVLLIAVCMAGTVTILWLRRGARSR